MHTKSFGEKLTRMFDIVISFFVISLLTPLFLLLIIILKSTGEGKILYRQSRIGRDGYKFDVLKFATMRVDSDKLGTQTVTLDNDPRVLPVGVYLRKWKLNELPQLWNVLCGEMSLVGPRPQPERCFYAFPLQYQKIITTVRPGITGIGSLVFRSEDRLLQNETANLNFYDEVIAVYKGELEEWYIQNKSVMMYFKILTTTAISVVFPDENSVFRVFPGIPSPPSALTGKLKN